MTTVYVVGIVLAIAFLAIGLGFRNMGRVPRTVEHDQVPFWPPPDELEATMRASREAAERAADESRRAAEEAARQAAEAARFDGGAFHMLGADSDSASEGFDEAVAAEAPAPEPAPEAAPAPAAPEAAPVTEPVPYRMTTDAPQYGCVGDTWDISLSIRQALGLTGKDVYPLDIAESELATVKVQAEFDSSAIKTGAGEKTQSLPLSEAVKAGFCWDCHSPKAGDFAYHIHVSLIKDGMTHAVATLERKFEVRKNLFTVKQIHMMETASYAVTTIATMGTLVAKLLTDFKVIK